MGLGVIWDVARTERKGETWLLPRQHVWPLGCRKLSLSIGFWFLEEQCVTAQVSSLPEGE